MLRMNRPSNGECAQIAEPLITIQRRCAAGNHFVAGAMLRGPILTETAEGALRGYPHEIAGQLRKE